MAKTLNQVIKQIKDLATAHAQIKSVWFGDLYDFLSRGEDNVYPAMFYDLTGASIAGREISYSFSFYFFDRVLGEQSNETEVLSDQLLIAQDIIAQLSYDYFDFELAENTNLSFFTEDTPDLLAGVKADITMTYPFSSDSCQVPSTYTYPS